MSLFDEPIMIDGKPISRPKSEYNEDFLRKYAPWLLEKYDKTKSI